MGEEFAAPLCERYVVQRAYFSVACLVDFREMLDAQIRPGFRHHAVRLGRLRWYELRTGRNEIVGIEHFRRQSRGDTAVLLQNIDCFGPVSICRPAQRFALSAW